MPTWSPQQDAALLAVSNWLKDKSGPQVFRLFGWAGTGKSTLARYLAEGVRSVKYAAFTGKAALVMRKKGCRGASTIHSLIYTLVSEKEGEPHFALDPESEELVGDSPAAEAERCLQNLAAVCAAAGTDLSRALRLTIYTTELASFGEINEAYAEFFPAAPPARVTVGVAALPKGARVEIDAIVALG